MPTLSESEIISKAMAGDIHAFRWIVEKHQAFAHSLSYSFVGNTSDAQDITQEAFIRLWKNLPRYRADVKLKTWLYKIITNLCLDHLKSGYHTQSRLSKGFDAHSSIKDPIMADHIVIKEELRQAMLKIAEKLTPKQKAVFVLRDLEDLTMNEIGEILSTSTGNIKSNLYYARMKMSELIRKYYEERKTSN